MYPPRRNTLTVTTTPLLVAMRVTTRKRMILNNVGSTTLYLSSTDSGITDTAFPLVAGQALQTDDTEAQYAFVSTGTGTIGVWDEC